MVPCGLRQGSLEPGGFTFWSQALPRQTRPLADPVSSFGASDSLDITSGSRDVSVQNERHTRAPVVTCVGPAVMTGDRDIPRNAVFATLEQ